MRMIVLPKLGGPEVLTLIDAPMPVAAADAHRLIDVTGHDRKGALSMQ